MKTKCKFLIIIFLIITIIGLDTDIQGKRGSYYHRKYYFVHKKIMNYMKKYKITGLSYAVIKGRKIVKTGFYGYSNIDEKIKTSKVTTYRVASISKLITAMAVMKLYEWRYLYLNTDISHYLGYRDRNPRHPWKKITVKMLLSHTSSLTDCGKYGSFLTDSYDKKNVPIRQILRPGGKYYSKSAWSRKRPGKKYQYSNLGYGILGTIIEKRTGMRFDKFCKKYILDKLEMNASYNVKDLDFFENVAVLYKYRPEERKEKDKKTDYSHSWLCDFKPAYDRYPGGRETLPTVKNYRVGTNAIVWGPQGGLRASALGMAHIMKMFNYNGWYKRNHILRTRTLSYMTKVHAYRRYSKKVSIRKGLGFTITKSLIPGRVLYGHSGRAFGLQSIMYMDKWRKSGIVILMNGGNYYINDHYPNEFNKVEKDLYRILYRNYISRR
jgi:CubicO group peptidase (beta-lactamase class C family)